MQTVPGVKPGRSVASTHTRTVLSREQVANTPGLHTATPGATRGRGKSARVSEEGAEGDTRVPSSDLKKRPSSDFAGGSQQHTPVGNRTPRSNERNAYYARVRREEANAHKATPGAQVHT